jgi:hypothetical protein
MANTVPGRETTLTLQLARQLYSSINCFTWFWFD